MIKSKKRNVFAASAVRYCALRGREETQTFVFSRDFAYLCLHKCTNNNLINKSMIYQFLATGFEDIEALAPLDIVRRAGLDITTVSITGDLTVQSAHGVGVVADALIEDIDPADADMLVLPGGLPGSVHLDECAPLRDMILSHHAQGKALAAICAAPMVFGHLGILRGVRATCYPGVEPQLDGAVCVDEIVCRDGNIITGRGPGAAMAFGYAIAEYFLGEEAVAPLREGMMYNRLFA